MKKKPTLPRATPAKKMKRGDPVDAFNAQKAGPGRGIDTDPNQPVTPLMIPHIVIAIQKDILTRNSPDRRRNDRRKDSR